MPVRFRCPKCRSKLSIARRKVGTSVACPSCQRMIQVPSVELIGASVLSAVKSRPDSQPAAPPVMESPLDDLPLFENIDVQALLESEVPNAPPPPCPAPQPTEPSAPSDGILIYRSTAKTLVAAMVVLLGLAFVAGYLVGSR